MIDTLIGWLSLAPMEAASGSNGAGLWCAIVASVVMIHRSYLARDKRFSYGRNVVAYSGASYTYLIVGIGLGLYAMRSAIWGPYYILMSADTPADIEAARIYQAWARVPAATLTGLQAANALLHLRFWFSEKFGAFWPLLALHATVLVFAFHAYLPRVPGVAEATRAATRFIVGL